MIRGPQRHLAAAGMLAEPQTAAGEVFFLHIQPNYVFLKKLL